jgi:hypothetical protein
MSKTTIKFIATPFTNELGQEIKVGEQIVAVSSRYARGFRVYEGIFAGLSAEKNGWNEYKFAVVTEKDGTYRKLPNMRIYKKNTKLSQFKRMV